MRLTEGGILVLSTDPASGLFTPNVRTAISTKSGDYTLLTTDGDIVFSANATAGIYAAAAGNAGRVHRIHVLLGAVVTLSATINGVANRQVVGPQTITLESDGTNWIGSLSDSIGWVDIVASQFKDDGTGGWAYGAIAGSTRLAYSASSTNTAKTIGADYHMPHDLLLNQTDSFFHLHWETTSIAAGNAIIDCYIAAALRDGVWSAEYKHTFTLTPSNYAANTHVVTEAQLNAALTSYLVPDAVWKARIVRDRGTNATDTFNNILYLHTADIHTRTDGRATTSKDPGTGWVKV